MKPIRIDFARSAHPWRWDGRLLSVRLFVLLILVSLALGFAASWRSRQIEQEKARALDALTQVELLQRKNEQRNADAARLSPEEEALLQLASRQRTLPWEALFQAYETTDSAVRLQSWEPDLARGLIKVQAHTEDLAAMQTYLQTLQRAPVFQRVVLQHHAVPTAEGRSGIDFAFEATLAAAYRLPEPEAKGQP